jgi:hypothetical protein
MDCSRGCRDSDYEAPALFSKTIRRSRKPYICCECLDEIPTGSYYEYSKGLWDDRWAEFKTCLGCSRIRTHICQCAPFKWLALYVDEAYDMPLIGRRWENWIKEERGNTIP